MMKVLLICASVLASGFMRRPMDGAPKKAHDIALRFGYRLKLLEDSAESAWIEDSAYTLQLFKNEKVIFSDTAITVWWKPNTTYPMIFRFGKDHDELLLQIAYNRYSLGATRLTIRGDSVTMDDELPCFLSPPSDLAGNGTPYLAHADDIRSFGDSMAYNPVQYYKLTSHGIVFDRSLTRLRNKRIYGRFYGITRQLSLDEFPEERLEKEIERIEHMPPMKLHGY